MKGWPEKFIYVCNATQASVVNALPLVHAGIDRIAEVVIFCGAGNAKVINPRLRREAIEPAILLESFVRNLAASSDKSSPPISRRYGDAERYSKWGKYLRDVCKDAEERGLRVVYNLTGGRKSMSIGACLGVAGTASGQPIFISVGGAPLRTEFLVGTDQWDTPRHDNLTIEQYLAIYGMTEIERGARERQESYYCDHQAAFIAFGDAMFRCPDQSIPALLRLTRPLWAGDGEFVAGDLDPQGIYGSAEMKTALTSAFQELMGVPGVSFHAADSPRIRVSTRLAGELLSSKWFEAYLFLKLSESLRRRNDVFVGANIRLRYSKSEGGGPVRERGEIDVALVVHSQLHIVEAKTGTFTSKESYGRTEQTMAQMESLKRHLLGQFGRLFIVNPREDARELRKRRGDFVRRAENAGIELILGRDCFGELLKRIGEL